MSIAHVQSKATTGTTASLTLSVTASAVGNLWIVSAGSSSFTSSDVFTISDSQANVWTACNSYTFLSGGSGDMKSWYAYPKNTSASTITIGHSNPNSFMNILVDEFSGTASSSPISANNSATGSGTPTVSVTPTVDNAMIRVASNDTITAVSTIGGTTATKGADDTQQDWSEYLLLSGGSGVAQSCKFTGSGSYIILAVAIAPAAGSGPTNHFLSLLGCGS